MDRLYPLDLISSLSDISNIYTEIFPSYLSIDWGDGSPTIQPDIKIYRDYKIDKFINDTITINQKIYNFLPKLKKKCFFLDTEQVRASKINHCINTFLSTKQKHKNHYYSY